MGLRFRDIVPTAPETGQVHLAGLCHISTADVSDWEVVESSMRRRRSSFDSSDTDYDYGNDDDDFFSEYMMIILPVAGA